MEADYSVELGPTAPALEFPWEDPEGRLHYFDLRTEPGSIEHLPEARQFPALRRFLLEVNSSPSAWQTAKCDVWREQTEAAENLYDAGFEQSSYVDLVLAGETAALRKNLEVHRFAANQMAQMLEANEALEALAEIVVRRCYFHRNADAEESEAGYCLTLFLTGYGVTPAKAAASWDCAMNFAAGCVLKLQPHEGRAQAREPS
jgi:hypothetical protein